MTAFNLFLFSADVPMLHSVRLMAEAQGWRYEAAASPWQAMALLKRRIALQVLLFDLRALPGDGLQLLPLLKSIRPAPALIVIDDAAFPGRRLQSLHLGASGYLLAPGSTEQATKVVRRSLQSYCASPAFQTTAERWRHSNPSSPFISESPRMAQLCAKVRNLSRSDSPLILCGEPGSGRDAFARLVHLSSAHCDYPMITLDCAALSEEALQDELFGPEGNNGSGHTHRRRGDVALSGPGTIYLKNYEHMPVRLQSALRRCVAGREECNPAKSGEIQSRMIASCSMAPGAVNAEGGARCDLLLPRGTIETQIPPLRDRKQDLALLAQQFMNEIAAQFRLAPQQIDRETRQQWLAYDWPGNLSELRRAVQCYLLRQEMHSPAAPLFKDRAERPLDQILECPPAVAENSVALQGTALHQVRQQAEQRAIAQALSNTGWNRMAAARILQISYRSILYKIAQYQIQVPHPPAPGLTASTVPQYSDGELRQA